jgi:hypothetical protein
MSGRRFGLRLFWCFFARYAPTSSGNVFRVPDEFEVYFQAQHLAAAGDLSIPQTAFSRSPRTTGRGQVSSCFQFYLKKCETAAAPVLAPCLRASVPPCLRGEACPVPSVPSVYSISGTLPLE